MTLRERINEWEQMIRNGRGAEVAASLLKLDAKKIQSSEKPTIAGFSRRVGEYQYGLKLLQSDFLKHRDNQREHEKLIAEYAALLTEIGATSIAERLLTQFKKPQYEMTAFYRALLWMKKWEYDKVPAEIATFKSMSSDPYRLYIADINLVSAFIVLKQFDKAAVVLDQLKESRSIETPMLAGLISEQEGELLFFTDQRKLAKKHFSKAIDELQHTKNASAFYAEKWLNIIELQEMSWDKVSDRWQSFEKRVRAKGYWEILREMDRYFAIKFERNDLLNKLYFGSPVEGYRKLLCEDANWRPSPEYFFPTESSDVFNTNAMVFERNEKSVAAPIMCRKLMFALSRDLYRPAAAGSLFEVLYPGQYYNPEFATTRVHRLIARLREVARSKNLQFKVEASNLGFQLQCSKNFALKFETTTAIAPSADIFHLIERHFSNKAFSSSELATASGLSKRTVNRILNEEVESERVRKSGTGKNVKYQFVK